MTPRALLADLLRICAHDISWLDQCMDFQRFGLAEVRSRRWDPAIQAESRLPWPVWPHAEWDDWGPGEGRWVVPLSAYLAPPFDADDRPIWQMGRGRLGWRWCEQCGQVQGLAARCRT